MTIAFTQIGPWSGDMQGNTGETLRQIYRDRDIRIVRFPFLRARHELANGHVDALAFTFDSDGAGIYPDHPFLCARMVALCTHGRAPSATPQSLTGLRLLWRRGYELERRLPAGDWTFGEVDSVASGLNMLRAGRADCLVEERQILAAMLTSERAMDGLTESGPLISRPVYLRFRDELESLPLMQEFDAGMERLLDDGILARYWGADQAACVRQSTRERQSTRDRQSTRERRNAKMAQQSPAPGSE